MAMFSFDESEEFTSRFRTNSVTSVTSRDEHYIPGPCGSSPPKSWSFKALEQAITEADEPFCENEKTGTRSPPEEEYEVKLDEEYVSSQIRSPHKKITPEDFEYVRMLGKGAFGTVFLVREKSTGRLYAQKQLKKASLRIRKKTIEHAKAERQILEEIRHTFVVKLFYAFQTEAKLYLILEYASGGELFTHLATERMFEDDVAAFYVAEIALALDHLHSKGIIYRDLKPENVLLDSDGHVLLTDFGLSKIPEKQRTDSFVGTVEYIAPEMLLGQEYDKAIDYWSLGILLHDLLTGSPPFTGNNKKKIMEKVVKCKLTLPYYLTPDAKDIISRLLKKSPTVRLGSKKDDFGKFKSHRFFRKINWIDLENRLICPPIVPVITSPELAENFSSEFTSVPIAASLDAHVAEEFGDMGSAFRNFTYIASPTVFGHVWVPDTPNDIATVLRKTDADEVRSKDALQVFHETSIHSVPQYLSYNDFSKPVDGTLVNYSFNENRLCNKAYECLTITLAGELVLSTNVREAATFRFDSLGELEVISVENENCKFYLCEESGEYQTVRSIADKNEVGENCERIHILESSNYDHPVSELSQAMGLQEVADEWDFNDVSTPVQRTSIQDRVDHVYQKRPIKRLLIIDPPGTYSTAICQFGLSKGYKINLIVNSADLLLKDLQSHVSLFEGGNVDADIVQKALEDVDAVVNIVTTWNGRVKKNSNVVQFYENLVLAMKEKGVERVISTTAVEKRDHSDYTAKNVAGLVKRLGYKFYRNHVVQFDRISEIIKANYLRYTMLKLQYTVGHPAELPTPYSLEQNPNFSGFHPVSRSNIISFIFRELITSEWMYQEPFICDKKVS